MNEVELARAYRTIPSGLFLISTARDGKPNVQFAFRGLGIWETPPLVLVGVQRSNYSHETIEQTREFVVNICGEGQIAAINASRTMSARNTDTNSPRWASRRCPAEVAAPLVAGCHASLECRVRAALPADEVRSTSPTCWSATSTTRSCRSARFMGKTFRLGGPLG